MKHWLMVSALIVLSGCQSALVNHQGVVRAPPEQTHREGQEQVANVGDYITSSVPLLVRESVHTVRPATAVTEHKGKEWILTAPAGPYVLDATSPAGKFYLSVQPIEFNKNIPVHGGLFVPRGQSIATHIAWAWHSWDTFGSGPFGLYGAPFSQAVEVTPAQPALIPVAGLFQSTLSYAGVAGGQIRFVYREFTQDGLARPAFTQEVAFDYQPEQTYGYKNARFVVHEADQVQVRYTLLSHM